VPRVEAQGEIVHLERPWTEAVRASELGLIAEIAHAGVLVSGAYWPDTRVGPDGFYLPGEFEDYLEQTAASKRPSR
jgi:hypothetical protein